MDPSATTLAKTENDGAASDDAGVYHGSTTAPPRSIGRYIILHHLGRGGMGTVYAAYDPELDRKVALKLLHAEKNDPTNMARLLREARSMARLDHPNIVAVHDVGTDESRLYIAMEFVRGKNLRNWLQAHADISWRNIVQLFVGAARGLAHAHALGIVHRDFKPDNLLVRDDGRVQVADFGLAKHAGHDAGTLEPSAPVDVAAVTMMPDGAVHTQGLTEMGQLLGTPAYMSPEQIRAGEVGPHSDQFSFCVSLYEALYHERPFVGGHILAIFEATLDGRITPPPPTTRVPKHLFRAISRGLAPDPAHRHASMDELLRALLRDPTRDLLRGIAVVAALLGVALVGWSLWSARQDAAADAARAAKAEDEARVLAEDRRLQAEAHALESDLRSAGLLQEAGRLALVQQRRPLVALLNLIEAYHLTAGRSGEALGFLLRQAQLQTELRTFHLQGRQNRLIGFNADARRLAVLADDTMVLLSAPTLHEVERFHVGDGEPLDAAWIGDSDNLVVVDGRGSLRLYDGHHGRLVEQHTIAPTVKGWHALVRLISAADTALVRVEGGLERYDTRTGQSRGFVAVPANESVAVIPRSDVVVLRATSSNPVAVNATTWQPLGTFERPQHMLKVTVFSALADGPGTGRGWSSGASDYGFMWNNAASDLDRLTCSSGASAAPTTPLGALLGRVSDRPLVENDRAFILDAGRRCLRGGFRLESNPLDATLTADGRELFVVGNNGAVQVYDTRSGEVTMRIEKGDDRLIAVTPATTAGWIATLDLAGSLDLWRHASASRAQVETVGVEAAVATAGDAALFLERDQDHRELRKLTIREGRPRVTTLGTADHTTWISTVSAEHGIHLLHDSKYAPRTFVSGDTVTPGGPWLGHTTLVARVCPDGRLLAIAADGPRYEVLWLNRTTGERLAGFQVHEVEHHAQFGSEISPRCDRIYVDSSPGYLLDTTSARTLAHIDARLGTFSPDGSLLFVTMRNLDLWVYDAASGEPRGTVFSYDKLSPSTSVSTDKERSVYFSHDGDSFAALGADGVVEIRQTYTLALEASLRGHRGQVRQAMFSPQDSYLLSYSAGFWGGEIDLSSLLWDLSTGRMISTPELEAEGGPFTINTRETLLASGHGADVKVWDVTTGDLLATFTGHDRPVEQLFFTTDDAWLVTIAPHDSIRIWDVASEPLAPVDALIGEDYPYHLEGSRVVRGRARQAPD